MPGTGEFDVAGTIPYDDIPQTYDPPSGFIWSANQRQVTADYPYYIGTASNFFDPGYRANEIKRVLSQPGKLGTEDMKALQVDTRDFLASEIVPVLLQALSAEKLSAKETTARDLLAAWDYRMETDSPAAAIWWTFWQSYLSETFDPWWKSRSVKVDRHDIDEALGQDLEAWTLKDPSNRAFSAPGVGSRTAADAERKAFHKTATARSPTAVTRIRRWPPADRPRRTDQAGGWSWTGAPEASAGSTQAGRVRTRPRAGTRIGSRPGGAASTPPC
jgi:penicillin amidase